jgi:exoribonuclease-2
MRDENRNGIDDRVELRALAERVMRERGFLVEPPPEARAAAAALREPSGAEMARHARDLTHLPWSSIDNDDSRDLDQLEVCERVDGAICVRVAIADVDHFVPRGGPIDAAAAHNSTSVYTAGGVFPMLDRRLSEGLTSLLEAETRLAMVTELDVSPDGRVVRSDRYPAVVRNHAKLTYDAVSAWLEGRGEAPRAFAARPELADQVRTQDIAARALRQRRIEHGALGLDTSEPRAVRDASGRVVDIVPYRQTRAGALVEDLMVAVNEATARFLDECGFPSLRRAVKTPERWDRIRALAEEWGGILPTAPDPRALASFLAGVKSQWPEQFEDVAIAVIKLVGRGEYVAKLPGQSPPGHFGLAIPDYAHSTAPNRRYPDVVTQRLLKAACAGQGVPYRPEELEAIGRQCSERERSAKKVERQVQKSAAALILSGRVGQVFHAVVTGASEKGTWVRIGRPVVEGRLVRGERGLDVGKRLRVRLESVDVERGFVDFSRE